MFTSRTLLACLVFLVIFFSCKQPQSFEYRDIRDVKLVSAGMNGTRASMSLVFFNPNRYGVNLRNVHCDVFVDSLHVGRVDLDTSLTVPAASEFVLPASMAINTSALLQNGLNLLFNREVSISAKGTTRVGKAGIFVNVPFDYSGKHRLDLF